MGAFVIRSPVPAQLVEALRKAQGERGGVFVVTVVADRKLTVEHPYQNWIGANTHDAYYCLYDEAGQGETPMTASFDAANRMTAITLNLGGANKSYSLSYGANGNLTRKQNSADPGDKSCTPGAPATASPKSSNGQTSTVQYLYEGQQALGEIRDGKLSHRLLTGLSSSSFPGAIHPFA